MFLSSLFLLFNLASAQSGSCGQTLADCLWEINSSTKKLAIQGNGEMLNYTSNSVPWGSYRGQILTVTIEGITSIGDWAFYECISLETISIPNSVTFIGDNAFSKCFSLTSISIPEGVTSIRNGTFSGCFLLMSISIPNSVTSIGDSAFSSCYLLEDIEIPESVTSIGNHAFSACFSLTTIGKNIHYFGSNSFSNSGIKSIVIGNGNEDNENIFIGEFAFAGCSNLKSVTIKPRLKYYTNNSSIKSCSIQRNAFSYSPKIETFIIDGYVDEVKEYAFLIH